MPTTAASFSLIIQHIHMKSNYVWLQILKKKTKLILDTDILNSLKSYEYDLGCTKRFYGTIFYNFL